MSLVNEDAPHHGMLNQRHVSLFFGCYYDQSLFVENRTYSIAREKLNDLLSLTLLDTSFLTTLRFTLCLLYPFMFRGTHMRAAGGFLAFCWMPTPIRFRIKVILDFRIGPRANKIYLSTSRHMERDGSGLQTISSSMEWLEWLLRNLVRKRNQAMLYLAQFVKSPIIGNWYGVKRSHWKVADSVQSET